MRKPLIIGDKTYQFKKDAISHYRTILNSYDFGQSLNEEDFNDIVDLFLLEDDNNSETDSETTNIKETFTFDKNHFSNYQIAVLENEDKRYIKCPTSKTKIINYENVEQLSRDIQIFKNERYFCIIDGDFIFGDFIETFLVCRNMKAKELTISTSSMSQHNVDSLYSLLEEGFIEKLNLIVSDRFFTYERDNLIEYIYETLDVEKKFQLSVCNNQSKIVLIQSDDNGGRKYLIQGSANLNSSNCIEQFSIEENEELFDFNKIVFDEIIEKFKTINHLRDVDSDEVRENIILDERASFDEYFEKEIEITDIKVSQVQYGTKCFEIFYDDLSSHYISYLMILNKTKYNPETLFYKACRNAIQKDMLLVKQDFFNANSVKGYVKCQETNELSKWEDLAVDHRQPNTFSVILDRFKEVKNINLETVEYTLGENNFIVFKNQDLTTEFINYHKDKANLRVIRKECNLSRTGMGRLKRSAKDLTIK
ncbi:hypothetical protein EKM02_03780 [Flavobacterium sp. RSP49]|uniref:hypothetical protein n=1 Tax=Flavobacterium sp. RSP49 TaxID=2497487 RepID=UPI000F84D3C1|nr:hypothetical protein [Flavobacterium sp. RSP49]RTZ02213.1 hypothetical protein EKM02_03780 [Flavobacterium sp. RSP49]